MMAIRFEPTEHRLATLYDRREPGLRLSRKTLVAVTAVAAFYAGLGAIMMSQKIKIEPAIFAPPRSIVVEPWRPETPPPIKPATKIDKAPSAIRDPISPPVSVPAEPFTATPAPDPVVTNGPLLAIPLEPTPIPTPVVEPTPTPTPGPVTIRDPKWLSKPTAIQLGRLYPERAARLGMKGAATLLCGVTANGSMVGCSVIDEAPKGFRFGEAALDSSRFFKMSPRTVDGKAVEGAKVRIPIVFNLTE